MDNWGHLANCANNCLGVDPNAVVIGGSAVLAAAAFGGLGLLQSVVGLGAVGAVGTGGLVAMGVCPPPYCTTVCVLINCAQIFTPFKGRKQMPATNNFKRSTDVPQRLNVL